MASEKVEPLTDAELRLVEQDAEYGGFSGEAEHTVLRLLATVQALQADLRRATRRVEYLEKLWGSRMDRPAKWETPSHD